jgi:hypothetical protein
VQRDAPQYVVRVVDSLRTDRYFLAHASALLERVIVPRARKGLANKDTRYEGISQLRSPSPCFWPQSFHCVGRSVLSTR